MIYQMPQGRNIEITTIILDLNGTLSVNGVVPDGVEKRIETLRNLGFTIVLFTGDTLGTADQLCSGLGIEWKKAETAAEKARLAQNYDVTKAVAIGNGLIDLELMNTVAYRIVTLQKEGVHIKTLLAADVVVPSIVDAFDLLINTETFVAMFRE